MGTPPESTLPSLPPPTPTVLSPLWSALSPPLWFVPWLLLLSVLMCPPLWCPTLPPLSTLESTLEFTPESTTATTTASVRLRPSPRLTLLCTPPESTLPLLPPPTPTESSPLLSTLESTPESTPESTTD